ncbi:uncharacterized protein LOC131659696 [Vicia villosa]|uniref:uncharacterized protein LOC131659696 n=1 Tax=Vicia villosa TaxID=3911 RepID=UPI00273B0614|nr:uncharacterized protein LOC131659696 [Vicia villosa]
MEYGHKKKTCKKNKQIVLHSNPNVNENVFPTQASQTGTELPKPKPKKGRPKGSLNKKGKGYKVKAPSQASVQGHVEAPTAEANNEVHNEVPSAEAPTAEVPPTVVPSAQAPTAEVPLTEVPTAEAPTAEVPTDSAPNRRQYLDEIDPDVLDAILNDINNEEGNVLDIPPLNVDLSPIKEQAAQKAGPKTFFGSVPKVKKHHVKPAFKDPVEALKEARRNYDNHTDGKVQSSKSDGQVQSSKSDGKMKSNKSEGKVKTRKIEGQGAKVESSKSEGQVQSRKSERLKSVKTKNIKGPGQKVDDPVEIHEDDDSEPPVMKGLKLQSFFLLQTSFRPMYNISPFNGSVMD